MSGWCYFATIVASFNLQSVGLEMKLSASALKSLFDCGIVFTPKLTTLLIRALVPLSELDLVSALSLTLLLMIMMACLHVVWWGWLVREHAAMDNMSAVQLTASMLVRWFCHVGVTNVTADVLHVHPVTHVLPSDTVLCLLAPQQNNWTHGLTGPV